MKTLIKLLVLVLLMALGSMFVPKMGHSMFMSQSEAYSLIRGN